MGALFGIALIAACARTVIRVRKFGRFFIDDYFFFLGIATLITGTGILYVIVPAQYAVIAVGAGGGGGEPLSPEFFDKITANIVIAAAGATITWVTIFAVKFSFLFFFRTLVRRLKKLTIWWWFILAVMIPAAVTDIAAIYMGCPQVSSGQWYCKFPEAHPALILYSNMPHI